MSKSERKIFNSQGFLTPEGKSFVQDRFVPELKRILITAQNTSDTKIIGCILKCLIDEIVADQCLQQKAPATETSTKSVPINVSVLMEALLEKP